MLYGIPETETAEVTSEDLVRNLIEEKPEIKDEILFARAHRIGARRDGKIRPIVAKFEIYKQRELVRKDSFKLKNTKLGVGEQFPKEVQAERKRLWPKFKQAKNEGKQARFIREKLFVDGQRVM